MKEILWGELGITPWQALGLVIGTTVMFWVFTALMSFFGQQMRARVTVTTFAVMSLIGSVTARSMLGSSPTMATGILVLLVLFAWEGVHQLLVRALARPIIPVRAARVVLRDGVIDHMALRRTHVGSTDLIVRLRRAGITHLADAAYAIVERDGSVTIIRAGQQVDPELLADVAGINDQPGPNA